MKKLKYLFLLILSFVMITSCINNNPNDDECKHKNTTWIIDVEATCTTKGSKHKECTDCEQILKVETIDAHHDLVHHETKNATCTEPGYEEYDTCKNCDYLTYKVIPSTGHSFILDTYKDATCTEDGYIKYICEHEGCKETKEQIILSTGHNYEDGECTICGDKISQTHTHSFNTEVIEPTCTTIGYTVYTCSCGYTYKDNLIDQKGHHFNDGVITKENTCDKEGIKTYTCKDCNESYQVVIPAGHNYIEKIIQEPTCTTPGLKEKECTKCHQKIEEVLNVEHDWKEVKVLKDPTCTTPGQVQLQCTKCQEEQTKEIDALGHIYKNGICERCGIKFIEDITEDYDHPEYGMYFKIDDIISNYGPDYINEYGVLLDYNEDANLRKVAVYLTQDGTMWRRCIAVVGTNITYATYVPYLSYNEDIKYTGLNSSWINTFTLRENKDGIWCYSNYTTIGANLEDNKGNLLLSLYNIGQAGTKTKIFDNLDEMIEWLKEDDCKHVESSWIVDIESTCTSQGSKHTECIICGKTLKTEIIEKLDHDLVHHEAKNATCTEPGYEAYDTCKNCDYSTYEEIDALGHNYVDGVCTKCNSLQKFNINYNLNGGTLPEDAITTFDINGLTNDNLPTPTKEGYVFAGWEPTYIPKGTKEDVTLTAKWTKSNYCSITYVVGDGTLPSNAPTCFEKGVGVALVDAVANDPTLSFLYWEDQKGNQVTRATGYEDLVLTAVYGVPQEYKPLWTLNQIGFDGKGMTYTIKVDDIKESDPFNPGYTGLEQTIKQEHQSMINSAYNISINYSNYGDDAPWGAERIKWINNKYMEGIGDVYAVQINSTWIPTLFKGGSVAELYDMNKDSGIFTTLSTKDGQGYVQDSAINQAASVKGKVYGYATGVARPDYFMYYNVDKVKELGLEDPAELWLKGDWTMSNFEKWVQNAQPKLGSGEYVLDMGFAESIIGLVASTGNKMASVQLPRLYLTNSFVTNKINWLQNAYASGLYYNRSIQDVSPGFQAGITLLHHGSIWFLKESTRFNPITMSFTIGVVPYPTADGEGGEIVTTTDVNEAIDLGGGKYLTDDYGNYIKTVDMEDSSFQVPYTGTSCYSIVNIENGKNGINAEIAAHILNDLVAGVGDDPNKKVNLTADESYRKYLESKLDRQIDVEVIMSCQGKTYFEVIELLSMTIGSGWTFNNVSFWPLAASMVKSNDSPVAILNEVLQKYKDAMTELGYEIQ